MSNEFHEDFRGEGEPLCEQSNSQYDFDWDGLSRNLGEQELSAEDNRDLGRALGSVIGWLVSDVGRDNTKPRKVMELVGRKTIALAWVINPDKLQEGSIRKTSKAFGLSPTILSKFAAEMSAHFGVSNPFQAHDWRETINEHDTRIETQSEENEEGNAVDPEED